MQVGRDELSEMAQRMLFFLDKRKIASAVDGGVRGVYFVPCLNGGNGNDFIWKRPELIFPGSSVIEYRHMPGDIHTSHSLLGILALPEHRYHSIFATTSEILGKGYSVICEEDKEGNLLQFQPIFSPDFSVVRCELEKLAVL